MADLFRTSDENTFTDPARVCSGVGSEFVATEGSLAETKEVVGEYSFEEGVRIQTHVAGQWLTTRVRPTGSLRQR